REVDRRLLAPVDEAPRHLGDDHLGQDGGGDRGDRADRAAAGQGQGGVAVGRAVVEDDVGEIGQAPARGVAGGGPGAVLGGGEGDEAVAALLDLHGQFDDDAVDARVGGDGEDVGRVHRRRLQEAAGEGRVAFEERI